MIRQKISKDIWKSKYQNNNETEHDYYKRIPKGLFGDLDEETLKFYNKIIGRDIIKTFEIKLQEHKCSLAGRGMFAVGTDIKNQTFSNCFVIPFKKDSMDAIMQTAKEAALTMKAGGGVGYSISILRPKTEKIKTSGSFSSGAINFLDILDSTCSVIKAGNNRRGAQMVALGIWHPSIFEFVTAKRTGKLTNFNMSVFVSDEFMIKVENDENWDLIFPDTTFEKYDDEWDGNIKLWKEKGYPVNIHETVKASKLWDSIIKSNYNFAEPGILFEDTINNRNTLFWKEYIQTCNPCGEQPLYWYGSCNLGPINISNHVKNEFSENAYFDWDDYIETIKMMTISLDKMLDKSFYPLQEQADEVKNKRLIGIGFTGLADAMCKLTIKYNSAEGVKFAEEVMKTLSEHSYSTSADLAKELGVFPDYNKLMLESYNVKMLSDDLQEKIRRWGLRNSRMTSIAPSGTTSLVMNNCSSGLEPIFALEYSRNITGDDGEIYNELVENDAWSLFKNTEYYKKNYVPDYFVTAQELKPINHLNILSVIQKWCCTSCSKTINCPVDIPIKDYENIYINAWKMSLKGCTTYRPNSILGSVLEIKKEEKENKKDAKKQQKEFFDIWKDQEKGTVVYDAVDLPGEYPMTGYKISSEGKKWYVHTAFKDSKKKRPFAIFVSTNNREGDVNTYDAIDKLNILALRKGIAKELIDKNIQKSAPQNNVNKICRAIGLLMRHNVKMSDIVKTLDNVDVPISSFIFRIKKFLMQYVDELPSNGVKCPECGAPVVYRDGCQSCSECFWSKCS